ncbi:hypothetical protein [Flavobacterium terrisoli]|uniref:hypothetical protein n=1 Tax=Flavobacterium terrisoli TaxID=3242195 RepID=UPI002542E4CF|nr:hypothetical protein [Flavobacterium buctense]
MKKKFLLLSFFLLSFTAFSQEIKIDNDIVTIDGKPCLKIEGDANNVSFLDMDGNELFFLKFIHNSKYGRVYNKITFLDQKLTFTSQSYVFTKKLLIKKLLADKTLVDCKLDPDKVERFVLKYDENIEK